MKKLLLILLLVPFLIKNAFAVNSTAINGTLSSVGPLVTFPESLNVFYPVFLMVMLCLFMASGLKLRHEQWAIIFPIGSIILCIVLSFVFVAPTDFSYTAKTNKITVEEIQWEGSNNVTYNTIVEKSDSNIVILSKSDQFRFTIATIFGGLMIFNALFSILVLTSIGKKMHH